MAQLTEQQIEAQIDAAIKLQPQIDVLEPKAVSVSFEKGRFTLVFNNDVVFSFMAQTIKYLTTLPEEILATVEITPSGKGLRFNEPDLDLGIQGILLEIFGRKGFTSEIAAKGGRSTSKKKQAASRANGVKGGRPRKKSVD